MNEAFEMLPFAGQPVAGEAEWEGEWEAQWQGEDEGEWEGERMRPDAMRGGMRGGGLRARPPLRGPRRPAPPRYQGQGRRPPRQASPYPPPLPYLPPRYRGWGGVSPIYPAIYPTLYPAPYPLQEPAFDDRQGMDQGQDAGQDQGQDGDQDQDGDQQQGEIPPTLAGTMGRVPEAAALTYQALGTLANALRDPNGRGPGLYVIEFDAGGRRRAYSGQTDDLHRRLLQHRLCGQMLAVDVSAHQVYVAPLASAAQRRRIEQRIHDDMFANQRGVLTNQRRELELAVMGEMWS